MLIKRVTGFADKPTFSMFACFVKIFGFGCLRFNDVVKGVEFVRGIHMK